MWSSPIAMASSSMQMRVQSTIPDTAKRKSWAVIPQGGQRAYRKRDRLDQLSFTVDSL
jgi:hypothetical protein